nr:hypothetical protein KPHV_06430 [Kitasatospora purpeofusca]
MTREFDTEIVDQLAEAIGAPRSARLAIEAASAVASAPEADNSSRGGGAAVPPPPPSG